MRWGNDQSIVDNGKYLEYSLDGSMRLRYLKDKWNLGSLKILTVVWDHIFVFSQLCITV